MNEYDRTWWYPIILENLDEETTLSVIASNAQYLDWKAPSEDQVRRALAQHVISDDERGES